MTAMPHTVVKVLLFFSQVGELTSEIEQLPGRSQLAAGFISYLGGQSEDARRSYLKKWCEITNIEDFDLKKFLSSESQMLVWKGEGLPSDNLSMENALIILRVCNSQHCMWQFATRQPSVSVMIRSTSTQPTGASCDTENIYESKMWMGLMEI